MISFRSTAIAALRGTAVGAHHGVELSVQLGRHVGPGDNEQHGPSQHRHACVQTRYEEVAQEPHQLEVCAKRTRLNVVKTVEKYDSDLILLQLRFFALYN